MPSVTSYSEVAKTSAVNLMGERLKGGLCSTIEGVSYKLGSLILFPFQNAMLYPFPKCQGPNLCLCPFVSFHRICHCPPLPPTVSHYLIFLTPFQKTTTIKNPTSIACSMHFLEIILNSSNLFYPCAMSFRNNFILS